MTNPLRGRSETPAGLRARRKENNPRVSSLRAAAAQAMRPTEKLQGLDRLEGLRSALQRWAELMRRGPPVHAGHDPMQLLETLNEISRQADAPGLSVDDRRKLLSDEQLATHLSMRCALELGLLQRVVGEVFFTETGRIVSMGSERLEQFDRGVAMLSHLARGYDACAADYARIAELAPDVFGHSKCWALKMGLWAIKTQGSACSLLLHSATPLTPATQSRESFCELDAIFPTHHQQFLVVSDADVAFRDPLAMRLIYACSNFYGTLSEHVLDCFSNCTVPEPGFALGPDGLRHLELSNHIKSHFTQLGKLATALSRCIDNVA